MGSTLKYGQCIQKINTILGIQNNFENDRYMSQLINEQDWKEIHTINHWVPFFDRELCAMKQMYETE